MKIIIKLVLILWCWLTAQLVFAQRTVFNVPNADVTEKGVIFLEHESQFSPWKPDAFWLGTHYSAYGIGHNTELDLSLYNLRIPDLNNLTLGTGFKTVLPLFKETNILSKGELKFTIGSEILFSLQGQGVGNWSYAHFSGVIPKIKTRLTAGISVGTKQIFGRNNCSCILAVEQPITKKFILMADWFSGEQNFTGYLIVGFKYDLPKDVSVQLGYQIPNSTKFGREGLVFEISKEIR